MNKRLPKKDRGSIAGGWPLAISPLFKKKPKLGKPTLSSLKKKLDKIFGQYIRKRDCDENGFGNCISCGRFRKLQAGHWIKRQHLGVRWHDRNCHGQCYWCNHWQRGNELEYEAVLIKKYGQQKVNALLAGKRSNPHFREFDYLAMIEEYKAKLERLQ